MIAKEISGAPARPKLRLVTADDFEAPKSDPVTRDCRLQRVRWLSKTYQLKWLVGQHTFGRSGIDCLEDGELADLHSEMERARECIVEGIPLEDVGLIRNIG